MLRVVFDTNVAISAQISRGAGYRCWQLAATGLIQLFHCQQMLAELSDKLRRPFNFDANDIRGVMFDYRRMSREVHITGAVRASSDATDDMFVECALVARAPLIVSSDRHLLQLPTPKEFLVVTPALLLQNYEDLSRRFSAMPELPDETT